MKEFLFGAASAVALWYLWKKNAAPCGCHDTPPQEPVGRVITAVASKLRDSVPAAGNGCGGRS